MKDVKWYTHNSTVGFMVAGNFEEIVSLFMFKLKLAFQVFGTIDSTQ